MRLACSVLVFSCAAALHAQDSLGSPDRLGRFGRYVQPWIGLHAAPGREAPALAQIREMASGWASGPLGSLVRTQGSGSPHRVVACGIDEVSYIVSHITDDGYLRVHVSGARARHPQWDAWHQGQRVVVITTERPNAARVRGVPGVFAVRSTHLWRGVATQSGGATTLDDLWIDVGAATRADVAALGIRLLDPVFRDMPDWSVADAVTGPAASAKAGCAAVVASAELAPTTGRTTFVVSTHSSFGWAGLSAVLHAVGPVDSVYVAHPSPPRAATGIPLEAKFGGTLVETVSEGALAAHFAAVARAAGTSGNVNLARLRLTPPSAAPPFPSDSLSRYAELLARLSDTYAVSGSEGAMRDILRARLPAWAREGAIVDSAGNLVLAMGPERDTVVFIAHMDEVGFDVARRDRDVLVLRRLGSFYPSLFSGQTALLHPAAEGSARPSQGCRPSTGRAALGVLLPRDTTSREADEVRAWFGDDFPAEGLKGATVTSYKCAARLGRTRFTARSIDDRLGSAAMVLALAGIDTARLTNKVIFIWSVREETGLSGARAAAAIYGPSVRRVHAVDTFVSADSPLETGRFAVAPIGSGAVLRAADNSSATPPDEIERVLRIARAAGIPVQIGTTNGGNDGSVFVPYGAVDVPLAWPLRYSHSPAEVVDLRDMRSLTRLITALAMASGR